MWHVQFNYIMTCDTHHNIIYININLKNSLLIYASTPYEAEVTSSNPSSPYPYVDMSKKKKMPLRGLGWPNLLHGRLPFLFLGARLMGLDHSLIISEFFVLILIFCFRYG
jgi:hypothetical protein